MADLHCPFSAPVVKKDAGCACAQEVIRRGGAEVACQDEAAHKRCNELYLRIKAESLALMGAEDDLLTLPHSVLVKVQYGGLAGLQSLLDTQADATEQIKNITGLVAEVKDKFNGLENLPFAAISQAVMDFRVSRRRSK